MKAIKITCGTLLALASLTLGAFKSGQAVEANRGGDWEKATVVRTDGSLVLVRFADGKQLFCQPDNVREPVIDVAPATSARPTHTSPTSPVAPPSSPAASPIVPTNPNAGQPTVDPLFRLPVTEAKVGSGKELLPIAPDGWQVPIARPDPKMRIPTTVTPVLLPEINGSYGKIVVKGRRAAIFVSGRMQNDLKGLIRVEVFGGATVAAEFPSDCEPVDLSPDGNLVVTRSMGAGHLPASRVDVFKPGAKLEHVISFVPRPQLGVDKVEFLGNDRLLISLANILTCWDLKTATELWAITASSNFELAPDGRHVATLTNDGLVVLDAMEGEIVGVVDAPPRGEVAWSSEGERIFVYARPELRAWDVKSGEQVLKVGVADQPYSGKMAGLDKDHVLFGGLLFSVPARNFVWRYEANFNAMHFSSGRVWTVYSDGRRKMLTSAQLPHASVKRSVAQQKPAEPLFAPGMSVSIEINAESDQETRDRVTAALTQQLQQAGFKVESNAPVRVVAVTETGPSETHEYIAFGVGGGRESVTVTRKTTTLSIERDGKSLWKTSSSSGGYAASTISMREGQSAQSVVDSQNQHNISWIGSTKLPTLLMPPVDPNTLPASFWAIGGVKDR